MGIIFSHMDILLRKCLPPTKASPAPLLSTISDSLIGMTGYSFTSPPTETQKMVYHSWYQIINVNINLEPSQDKRDLEK